MKIIDCVGLSCPIPVINTKKYFDGIDEGEAKVIVDNEVSKNNVEKFANNSGFTVEIKNEDNNYSLFIKKLASNKNNSESDNKDFTIVISTDEFGNGNPVLGKTLMKSYIYALSEANERPNNLIFLNSGVKLTVKDSAVLESLELLKNSGTNIYSCGACLDFYNLTESLAIGEISNMYSIVEMMNKADKTIKL